MSIVKKNICEAIEVIDFTSDLFYQQKKEDGLKALNTVLEKLMYAANEIFAEEPSEQDQELKEYFNHLLTMTMKALEKNDMILFSDILQFEIKEFLLTHNI